VTIRCDDALPLLYDLVDGDIDRDGAVALADHLARCPACAAALAEIEGREALYRERLGAVAPARTSEEVANAVWNEGAVPVGLAADRAPFAFALGTAAAAALAAVGTSEVWGPHLESWLDAARSSLGGVSPLVSTRPAEMLAGLWDSARGLLAPASGLALTVLVAIALVQVGGSAWLLNSGGDSAEEAR
jgi:anti-sigma factor RsiW